MKKKRIKKCPIAIIKHLRAYLIKEKFCPECSESYTGFPALSRRDNKTEICGSCGTLEGISDWATAVLRGKKNLARKNENE